MLRQHQRAQASAVAMDAPNVGLAGEMDNGSFIATLSAELREEVINRFRLTDLFSQAIINFLDFFDF